jgi:hypothetical protein
MKDEVQLCSIACAKPWVQSLEGEREGGEGSR